MPASAHLEPPGVIPGKIVSADGRKCEIEFSLAFPPGAEVGRKVGALIDVDEIRDAVFFGRPADSSANSDASVFVIEPDGQYAR